MIISDYDFEISKVLSQHAFECGSNELLLVVARDADTDLGLRAHVLAGATVLRK